MTKLDKYKKWSTVVHVDGYGLNMENVQSTNGMSQKNVAKAVKKKEVVEEITKKCVTVDNPTDGSPA
jgi:hypothetical protein